MNKGKYVFSQMMTYFPRWVFEAAVEKYNGDFHAKNLNSYSHCLHLMFGQMAGCKSLKDVTLVLRSIKKAAYHLGIQRLLTLLPCPRQTRCVTTESSRNLACGSSAKCFRCTRRRISLMCICPVGRSSR